MKDKYVGGKKNNIGENIWAEIFTHFNIKNRELEYTPVKFALNLQSTLVTLEKVFFSIKDNLQRKFN